MAQIRTLKLNLLADVTKFGAGMVEARGDINKLSTTATRAGKAVAAAFTGMAIAAGYASIAIGKDSVKAALEDEVSQDRLATTLKNVTGATDDQITATEKWITKAQFASGFTDGELRDSLGRLTRSTEDVSEAQEILGVAMDISRGTGKDLTTVSENLAKAVDGNFTPLKKMGIKIDENVISTGNFQAVLDTLSATFNGQASAYADTYQGKLDIVNQRLGELKESAGVKLVGVLGNLLAVVNDVAKGFGGEEPNSLSSKVATLQDEMGYGKGTGGYQLGKSLSDVATAFGNLFGALTEDSNEKGISNLERLADAMESLAININKIAEAYRKGKDIFDRFKGFDKAVANFLNPTQGRAMGGSVRAGQAYTVGEFGKETFIPNTNGQIVPNNRLGGGNTTINLNGIIDAESARRAIERLLQDSGRRTAAINLVGSAF